jgi:hypothetical protein
MIIGLYQVMPSWGYAVGIFDDSDIDNPVEFYTAGNALYDSQVYEAEQRVDKVTLRQFAKATLQDMLQESGHPKAKIFQSKDLINKDRNGIDWVFWPAFETTM